MWIMLNNRPLDISKIKGISEVKTLDSKYFLAQCEKRDFHYEYDKPEIDTKRMKIPEELMNMKRCDLKKDAEGENKVWGYFFYIREIVCVQAYKNGFDNGVHYTIEKIYSKVYSSKEQAQTALEYLLSEMNELYNKMLKVEI